MNTLHKLTDLSSATEIAEIIISDAVTRILNAC